MCHQDRCEEHVDRRVWPEVLHKDTRPRGRHQRYQHSWPDVQAARRQRQREPEWHRVRPNHFEDDNREARRVH